MTPPRPAASCPAGRSRIDDPREPPSDVDALGLPHESGRESANAVDFAFLAAQTFDDDALERELLGLFLAQARRVLPTLPLSSAGRQSDAAHLLKGSARGIGAFAAAAAAEAYEQASAARRPLAYQALSAAFAAVEAAITERLSGPSP